MKASSPNEADREWTSRTLTGEGEGATATESSVRACCPAAHSALVNSADASFSSLSASTTRRWFKSRRCRRRTVVSLATASRRRACSRCAFSDWSVVRRGEDVPIFGLSVGRGCTILWCSDGVADCRCQRAPKSEGASSALGVGCLGSSAVGALCPRDTYEPSSEVSLSCVPLSRDSFPTSVPRVLAGEEE